MSGRFLRLKISKFFLLSVVTSVVVVAQQKPVFTVGWSVYVGWNPYYYMAKSGILRKWADKYGIDIKVQRFDYAASLDAFVAKNIDACAMTNMEALDMPAAAGVDTTAVLPGDYSDGNDAVITRQNLGLAQLPSKQVMLVEKTVSQYLFERAMTLNGLASQIKQVRYVNTSDSDIAYAFLADAKKPAVVTWRPLVSQIMKSKDVKMVFNSSQIPGVDEAFSALDPATRGEMQRLIHDLWRQSCTTIVFVTHNTRKPCVSGHASSPSAGRRCAMSQCRTSISIRPDPTSMRPFRKSNAPPGQAFVVS